MKFLVTGCCGFIGSHAVDFLLKKGHKVLVVGEPSYNVNTYGSGVKVEVLVNAKNIELQTFDKSDNSVSNNQNSGTDDDDLPF